MARWASIGDCYDPVVVVEEADLEAADRLVDAILSQQGIDPAEVTPPAGLALLRDLGAALATARAAMRGAVEVESPLWRKQQGWKEMADALAKRVDRESLGLAAPGSGLSGYGSIPVGRG